MKNNEKKIKEDELLNEDNKEIIKEVNEHITKRQIYLKEAVQRESKKRKMRLLILLVVVAMYAFLINYLLTKETYISKNDIKVQITTAINNKAKLDVLKNIYLNRQKLKSSSFTRLFQTYDKKTFYNYNTPLSQILFDLKSDYYLNSKDTSISIDKLNNIINSYQITNPFDTLESSQKDLFKNIRLKLSNKEDEYKLIHDDLEKIANNLGQKNNLVNEYLKDSTNSFWISISAIIFSAIIGLFQLYLAREDRFRQMLSEEIKKSTNSNKNNFDEDEIPF